MSKCAFDKDRNCMDDCEWYLGDPVRFDVNGEKVEARTQCAFVGIQLSQTYLSRVLIEQNKEAHGV